MNRISVVMMLLMSAPALAHSGPRSGTDQAGAFTEDRIELRLSRAGVDPSALASLRPTLAQYAAQLAPLRQNAWQTRRALKEALANPQPDSAILTRLTDQLSSDREQMRQITAQEMAQVRRELAPEQYARLLVTGGWEHRGHDRRGDRR
jgi:hypothetical protein